MELSRHIYFLAIIIILLVGVTPQGQKLLQPDTPSNIQSIDKAIAGIESNTDGISNLLTVQVFKDEDFAQETTLSAILTNVDMLETYTSGTEDNTERIKNSIEDIQSVQGQDGRSTDAFGERVTKNTQNLLNLPAHNPVNRERWRLKIDDVNQNLQYNSYPEYEKTVDAHHLTPDPGDTVTLESAESPPYVVHYELWYSWAASVNRTLETGDVVRIGAFTDENGYFLKMNSTSGTDNAYMMVRRNGTNTKSELVSLQRTATDFTRFELRSNWYNAGEQTWLQTTTNSSREDVQKNDVLGYTATNGNRLDGPELPQLPIRFQVHRGSGSSGLELTAGSANILVAGDVNAVSRSKTDYFTEDVSQAGLWEPVAAIRLEPDASFILSELGSVDLAETSASTDFFVTAQSHDPDLVLSESGDPISTEGTGWQPPSPLSSGNSVLQFTSNVSQAANENGSVVGSTSNPGGFQVGWGSLYSSGNKGGAASSAQQDLKRPLYGSDVIVFWVKADDEGNPSFPADVSVEYVVESTY